jgi:DeoR family transcriptional regulator, aga operon transcriptional repressor
MKKAERWNTILQRLAHQGGLSVSTLADDLGVSVSTIRRDFSGLQASNLLHRVHGGAMTSGVLNELSIGAKSGQHLEQKQAIAREGALRVSDGMAIGMSGGTTVTELAKALSNSNITVVTNALNIAAMLMMSPNIELIVTGGIARPKTAELVGPIAETMLSTLTLDLVFIGADGVSLSAGLTTNNIIEARTNLALLRRAHRTICLVDSAKLGRASFAQICPFSQIAELVTDDGADPTFVSRLQDAGLNVTVVPLGPGIARDDGAGSPIGP